MITNHILEDKWRVQKELAKQAGHDPGCYIALAHKGAVEAQERYGIRFRAAAGGVGESLNRLGRTVEPAGLPLQTRNRSSDHSF
jgi:hypothetical protein